MIYGIVLLLSYLMVSNILLMSLKFKDSSLKNNMPKYILAAIAIVAAIVLKWVAIPVVFVAYVIVSLAFKNKIA
jgi:CDP-diacylglycerol--serine O-phosphatidyltransferase